MELNSLQAISPVDGRYRTKVERLSKYFSEMGLIAYRVQVEVEYLIALSQLGIPQLPPISDDVVMILRKLYLEFDLESASRIKAIEQVTNHDVKAVEYFIKEQLEVHQIEINPEFIHFGLTSQDVNNTAIPRLLQDFFKQEYLPQLDSLIQHLKNLASSWKEIPMLARTHGQPASPTQLGKEIMVFVERLEGQKSLLTSVPFKAKFGGATGNFNAHYVAYPNIDWVDFANRFAAGLDLERSQVTTQIEPYDHLAALFDASKRINTILVDLARDLWQYISMDYFKQKIKAGEVGSSAMPHKVNPIDFENAEGNLGMANAILEYLSAKLPVSRLQRDLTDSTVLRNVGVPMAHTLIAFQSLSKGLGKLELNQAKINQDLEANWAVVAEAIQTILRRENYPNPYEALKALTRTNQKIDADSIQEFIHTLEVGEEIKEELLRITPFNYTGIKFF